MGDVSMDMSEVHRLAADFGRASANMLPLVDAVVKKAADNVTKDLNAQAAASEHFKAMAGAVTYDRAYGLGSVGYVVGPDKDRRGGALGNIFFFGGVNGGGGTGDLDRAVTAESPRMMKSLGDLGGGLL